MSTEYSTSLASLFADHLLAIRRHSDAALSTCRFDSLAIYAGRALLQFLDDQPYPFKANPHFKWWTPLQNAADCWLLYQPTNKPQLVFFQPVDYWHKPPALPVGFWTAEFDIVVIREPAQARNHVAALKNCAFIGEWQAEFEDWGFAARNPAELLEQLHYPRARKTPYELECMHRASRLGARGHRAAEAAFRRGASEYEIHLEYLRATQHVEAELPYPNIIALNDHASVLHYQHQERRAPDAAELRSFLIDAGAQFAGYACDITRTYSAFNDDFAALIAALEEQQRALCGEVRSGTDYAEIHLSAHARMANLLRQAGIISADPDTAVSSGLSSVFFPHGVGHLLGLQVHDIGGFSIAPDGKQKAKPSGHPYLRLTRTLEPGFVVTVEPGIYFIDMLLEQARSSSHASFIDWSLVEKFRPCGGIRIEDNVVCTTGAPENLTRAAFSALDSEE